ncbi:MAG: CoB--CoM heterodisulfide reductase iron-sulfur subunit A family protein [Deltaproteobacteria bacterium]|nr:CoB--CoM heterodisulfide reductase iron-sulfur subunit A family protein [Deltaproteobacteria bacterium]
MTEKTNPKPEETKIGVYVCYCGGNISDVVDVEKVAEKMREHPNVTIARTDMSMCSDAGQSIVENDIKELGLTRVVIGACAPSLHEHTFRGTVARGGLNPYYFHHVGLREQDSWVHSNNPGGATEKAVRLMYAGIAKANLLKPLDMIKLKAERHALVIGGGVAGLRAAYDIAGRGINVTLIEKTPFLGGRMAQLETVFPTGNNAREDLHSLINEVRTHPLITIHTLSELVNIRGYIGNYDVQIRSQSRGVSGDNAEAALAACTQEVPDDFNYGLTKRKVVYRAYEGCFPSTPAVDWEHYDGKPIEIDGQKVIFENKKKTFDLRIGAIVIATGFQPYEPPRGDYGYDELPEVVTLPQFIRYMGLRDGNVGELTWKGHPVRDIAAIHCVGSRHLAGVHEPQPDGILNNYCSRVCCTATLHQVNELLDEYPNINVYDFYEDIRTYGLEHESYYTEASKNMVRFLRFHGDQRPEVAAAPEGDTHPVLVKGKDYLTNGLEIEVPVDLVILAVGMVPRPVDDLVDMMKIPKGDDRFLLEVHPKLRPVETPVPGIVLAGTAQSPMNIQESCNAASAAAAKVSVLLASGQVELDPFVAKVDLDKCTGTGDCIEVCEYEDAIVLETMTVEGNEVQRAVVTPANCSGCGNCVSACPHHAIDVQGWEVAHYEAMVDAITMEVEL